jgi:hypothetical protein
MVLLPKAKESAHHQYQKDDRSIHLLTDTDRSHRRYQEKQRDWTAKLVGQPAEPPFADVSDGDIGTMRLESPSGFVAVQTGYRGSDLAE